MQALTTNDKITVDRLIALPKGKLENKDRCVLLGYLPALSRERLLDILQHHGHLEHPAQFVTELARELDPEKAGTFSLFMWEGPWLIEVLGEDGYADLVERLILRAKDPSKDETYADLVERLIQQAQGPSRNPNYWFAVQYVRGCSLFNEINAADWTLGLRLFDIRRNPKDCRARLVGLASTSDEQMVSVWGAAQRTSDAPLKEELSAMALKRWDFSWAGLPGELSPGLARLLDNICAWVAEPEQKAHRQELLWQQLTQARTNKVSWSAIAFHLPSSLSMLKQRARHHALECRERTEEVRPLLKEELSKGSASAWDLLLEWMEPNPGMLRLWELVRDSPLPGVTDEAFWQRFIPAWRVAAKSQEQQISFHISATTQQKDLRSIRMAEEHLAAHGTLFPRMDDQALFERIVSCKPTAASSAELTRILQGQPSLLRDWRVRAFADDTTKIPIERSEDIEAILDAGNEAVDNFRYLGKSAADKALRAYLKEFTTSVEPWDYTLAEWSHHAWVSEVVDDELRGMVRSKLLCLPASKLLEIINQIDGWVSREEVAQVVRDAPHLKLPPRDLPPWLSEPLLARLGICPAEEVKPLIARLASSQEQRQTILGMLARRSLSDPGPEIADAFFMLLETRNAWEKYAPGAICALLVANRPEALLSLLSVASKKASEFQKENQADQEGQTPPFLAVLHHVLAEGILRWVETRVAAGDHEAAELGFIAIAHLDPPPPFTRKLRAFAKRQDATEAEKNWAEKLNKMVAQGPTSVTVLALRYCLEELVSRHQERQTSG